MILQESNIIEKGLYYVALVLALVSAAGMTAIVAIITVSVTLRKFFDYPLYFSEELVGILMSVLLFMALPMVTLKGNHIRLSIVTRYVKVRSEFAYFTLTRVAYLFGAAFSTWLMIEAVPWLEFAIRLKLKTETARILLYPWMLSLPVSIFVMNLIFIAKCCGLLKESNGDNT